VDQLLEDGEVLTQLARVELGLSLYSHTLIVPRAWGRYSGMRASRAACSASRTGANSMRSKISW